MKKFSVLSLFLVVVYAACFSMAAFHDSHEDAEFLGCKTCHIFSLQDQASHRVTADAQFGDLGAVAVFFSAYSPGLDLTIVPSRAPPAAPPIF